MADRYANFDELAANEKRGTDYDFWLQDRKTPVAVIAPHGGWIEPGTSETAKAIAQADYSIYVFEGLRRGSRDLHITSTHFDEPKALELIRSAETAVAIHGRTDDGDPATVWIGGRDGAFRDAVALSLRNAGFEVAPAPPGMEAADLTNICNRGTGGGGVQLELPRTLRNELKADFARMESFSAAVREAITDTKTH